MVRQVFAVVLFGVVISIAPAGQAQEASKPHPQAKIPEPYVGNWVCQTFMPGYNVLPPHADMSQPQTNKMTTPSTVAILKFSLQANGVYEASGARGHYSFNPTTRIITWLDGPHEKTMTKTQIGKREDGAPKIGFTRDKRYYGCFMPKSPSK